MNEQDRWLYRRRVVFSTVFGCFAGLTYLMGWGVDTQLHRSIAETLGLTLSATVLGYIAGPVADDFLQKRIPRRAPQPIDEPLGPARGRHRIDDPDAVDGLEADRDPYRGGR